MSFFKEFFKAITNSIKGFSFIFEKGLWSYMFYPVLVWIVMWIGSIWLFATVVQQIADYLNEQLNFNEIPDEGALLSFAKPILTGYFSMIITWILKIVFWFIKGTFIKYMALILLSPLFALLSESVEEKINGNKFPFKFSQLLKDIGRGMIISFRNMILEYILIFICFIISIIFPPMAIITVPFLLFVSWYFIGFTMLDYNFERHKMTISQSVKFVRKHRGLACGIGLIYSFFMLFPLLIGLMFGPVISVVGATISYLEIKQQLQTNETI